MTKVVRSVPIYFRPYMLFSIQVPKSSLICDQTEGEAVLFAEALVALGGVTADADDLIACLPELAVSIPETACLSGTSGGIILGVKVEDDPLTRVL